MLSESEKILMSLNSKQKSLCQLATIEHVLLPQGNKEKGNTKQRVAQGGFGLNLPLELDILQKHYYLHKEINCFRILFAC